ncbi:hypothetical protein EMIHUDRAFT_429140 [Emiliania huxleyi CCMP1516]|uniref:UMP-CMP kinase n=2 Tax=Emiliania huxleyi TaxID=2903 RepID=A0A0D3KLH3_EMIH1|nr:hypothetical protein EMIHUDRAFT_429140 [Emiliania huxleyi CCMP1516]EOD36608.1 hypothetical protein EMIHUDRAFT_429140 [Emiliania huxleyi CCMP1516]|eukprot:XP_005789037.1 hypothetical protein EMIHUDRAFT_429140 [Emiliania huxleyi CCMP1516]
MSWRGALSRRLAGSPRAAAIAASGVAGWLGCAGYPTLAEPASAKRVDELTLRVPPRLAADFEAWLPSYVKQLVELPGFLGAKLLSAATPADEAPAVVFVLGGPGAGKGTQCARIVEKHGYVHLSAGDLLRAERTSGSAQGQMIDEYIREGKIVPVEVTVKLLLDAIRADGGRRFLVDGFPRNTNNLSGWQGQAGSAMRVAAVLVFDCPEEVMEERLLERGKTSGRSDDNAASIRKRFATFRDETTPVLKYYEHQGLVTTIDGTRPVDEVWADTTAFIDSLEAGWRRREEA